MFSRSFAICKFLFLPYAAKNSLDRKSSILVAPVFPQFRPLTEFSAQLKQAEGDGGGGGIPYSYIRQYFSEGIFSQC